MNNDSLLTADARRHVREMLRAIGPLSAGVERQFRRSLRELPHGAAVNLALLAITPVAASRLRTVDAFIEQVEYQGRRIARMNLPPGEVIEILGEFDGLLEEALGGRHAPAREQLLLVTRLVLNRAYYQVREGEVQAFFGLYHAEAEARDLDHLLDLLVRILTRAFGAQSGRLHLSEGRPGGKLAHPLHIERGRRDEHLIACPRMRRGCASYWSFPIQDSALLQLGFRERHPWLPRELVMLHAAGARCQQAIQRVRMQNEVRRLEAETRRAEEEERRRIGRELHDETGQSLVWLRLQLEMLEGQVPPALGSRVAQARGVTEQAVEDLRRTIAALSPAVLERLGLPAALRQLAARFGKQHSARVDMRIPAEVPGISREASEVIYRVAQESLQNILKHSGASRVKLLLRTADKNIRLSIQDDGSGFSPETAGSKPLSFGLAGMRDRAALLGGTLLVCSAPGKGARILLDLPRSSANGTY